MIRTRTLALILAQWLALATAATSLTTTVWADAPGHPGIEHTWSPALKQAVGTAYEADGAKSPVWFTVAEGIVTEVFYPSVDQAQVGDLQFLVTDGKSYFSEQKRDATGVVVSTADSAAVHVSGHERDGRYSYEQTIVTDPAAPVVRIRTTIHWNGPGLRLFILFKPAIQNTGSNNLAYATQDGLYATKAETRRQDMMAADPVHAALVASAPWAATSAGYVGVSDGWQVLSRDFHFTETWPEAGPGNVALTGELQVPPGKDFTYELALGFGASQTQADLLARTSLAVPFADLEKQYNDGWRGYQSSLAPWLQSKPFAVRSARIIKMHEDKEHRGAIVASMSKPAIPDGERAMDGVGGYHLVWPRDLYHAAMGLLAAGDTRTPVNVLAYYRSTQRFDGSWPQNFWVSGVPYWPGLQMDEVSFPILLAWQLYKRNVWQLSPADLEMVRKAADFIATHGPMTQEDRWEEMGGYVPSTLAAEIAALRAASRLTSLAQYARIAAEWQGQLENWTLVRNGPHGQNYYLRASPHGTPWDPEPIGIANGGGNAFAWDLLDGGFLDLVRFGIRPANDANILSTLRIYEDPSTGISAETPAYPGALAYRRYNRDAYGTRHVGGFWPLLAGERGHYALAAGDLDRARTQLALLEASALPSGTIPEQVNDVIRGAIGAGVAAPLVWAHAEDLRLGRSLEDGAVFDAP